MKQWGDMSQVFIGNGRARLPESLDDSGNLERVPQVSPAHLLTEKDRVFLVFTGE
jgi:hypothetical protein